VAGAEAVDLRLRALFVEHAEPERDGGHDGHLVDDF
jgi:hypothetical protein